MEVGKTVLAVLAVISTGHILFSHRFKLWQSLSVYKNIRPAIFIQCFALLILTVALWSALEWIAPFTKYGWMSLFYTNGGNAGIQPITDLSKSGVPLLRVVPIIFMAAFIVIIPIAAELEERFFREGISEWPAIFRKSVVFGLWHCIVGVPLAVGIALSLPGLFYAWKYKRASEASGSTEIGIQESTLYHSTYNLIIAVIISVGSAAWLFV